jgi:aspartate kinase
MALIVQKYGGSSVADVECMRRVAQRILATRDQGNRVVVVVSAMGDTTDDLIDLAKKINAEPDERELDALMATGEQISSAVLTMALHAMGAEAVSMTGPQAGIYTDGVHTKAKIRALKPKRLIEHLKKNRIVVVAGFQGLNPNEDIATLGRGGSDTTAVALAAAVKADRCQILKDVEGVYTANPRIVPEARKVDEISYDEMLELASMGAEVLQSRAVEFAKNHGVVLEVLSSFVEAPGTLVTEEVKNMEDIVVRGVASDKHQAKVTIKSLEDKPGVAAVVFTELAKKNINVDMIVQNVSEKGETDITFTVPRGDLAKTRRAVESLRGELGTKGILEDEDIAKVSIVGVGMRSHSGVAARMFETLAKNNVNIQLIATSEIKISVVIRQADADKAVQALHKAFELGKKK